MKKRQAIIAFLILISLSIKSVQALSVGLVSFTAVSASPNIQLEWVTATELDTAGFLIYRAADGETFELLTQEGMIPAVGNPTVGGVYHFLDDTAVALVTYTYQLVEIQLDGRELELDQTTAQSAFPATPIQMGLPSQPPASHPTAGSPTSGPSEPSPIATDDATTLSALQTEPPRPASVTTNSVINSPAQVADSNNQQTLDAATGQPAALESMTQPQLQSTPEDAYPPPITHTPLPEGYVAPPTITPFIPTQTPEGVPYVPPATIDRNITDSATEDVNPNITVIGEDNDSIPSSNPSPPAAALDNVAGRLYLWVGFVIALLIFITAVVASSLIFTRKAQ